MFQSLLALALLAVTPWTFPKDLPKGVLSEETLKQHNENVLWADLASRLIVVDESAEEFRPFVRVRYPRGQWGSNKSGAQFAVGLTPAGSYRCEYYVRFAPDFDFVRGGKLPGLAGGTATAGSKRPTGDGWTSRYMWRADGRVVLYLYHLDQPEDYGEDFSLGESFQPGKWHHLIQEVQVNDPGKANGRIQVWFDGSLKLDQQNLRLREASQAPVDRFYFSTFFGGSGSKWAPQEDQHIDFAQFNVRPISPEK